MTLTSAIFKNVQNDKKQRKSNATKNWYEILKETTIKSKDSSSIVMNIEQQEQHQQQSIHAITTNHKKQESLGCNGQSNTNSLYRSTNATKCLHSRPAKGERRNFVIIQ